MDESSHLLGAHREREKMTFRAKTWKVLHYESSSLRSADFLSRMSRFTEMFILYLIIINIGLTIAASMQIDEQYTLTTYSWYFYLLCFSTIVFTIEYVTRLWSCVEDSRFRNPILGRIKWMLRPLSVIDLIAIIPFYIEIFVTASEPSAFRGAMSIRALRLLRVLSFLRIERSYKAVRKLRKIFHAKKEKLLIVSYITSLMILFSSTTIFFLEHGAQPEVFSSVAVGAWWTVETITSLGYGDTVPITTAGRIFGSFVALCGIVIFSIPGAILGSGFIEVMLEHQQQRESAERQKILDSIASEREREYTRMFETSLQNPTNLEVGPMEVETTVRRRKRKNSVPAPAAESKNLLEQTDALKIISEKFNQLINNQRLLELQLKCQQDELANIVRLLQRRTESPDLSEIPYVDGSESENSDDDQV